MVDPGPLDVRAVALRRAVVHGEVTFPNYDQEPWVESQAYDAASWDDLIRFWSDYNRHLLRVIAQIPEDRTDAVCRIGNHGPMSLAALLSSYGDHMEHHLNQILSSTDAHTL